MITTGILPAALMHDAMITSKPKYMTDEEWQRRKSAVDASKLLPGVTDPSNNPLINPVGGYLTNSDGLIQMVALFLGGLLVLSILFRR